ncbi:hypothetical protein [Idiomarina sp.]|uniref:hypothetical protein n=1 Tax=Idiomarina sp. TaxID=1874361 RepID=UPI001D7EE3EF|nr:hypothetical protein [Idiomarina sp.]MCJ8317927.1 hypothetical protein [Idiomarina sp.]NQZ17582.1 hypothetical protein [Idiomarina sp.]
MLEDLSKSIRADLYERSSSPLLGAFLTSWLLWNWKVVLVIFSSMGVVEKISHIDAVIYSDFWLSLIFLIFGPLSTALLFLYLYPIPAKHVYRHFREQQKSLKEIKVEIEEETPLSKDEHNKLRRRLSEMESAFYEELARKDAEIERLRSLLESANKPISQRKKISDENISNPSAPSKSFPLSDTDQPVITEVILEEESYRLGKDFKKSEPGSVNVLKPRNDFNYQDRIRVTVKTSKPLLEGQFYDVFDGHSRIKLTDPEFELHKTDYEKKNAFVVVAQPNPSRKGKDMNVSNKVQFPY